MKKLYAVLAAVLVALVSGCATTGTVQTPAQIASQVCPPVQTALTSLQAVVGLSDDAKAKLAEAAPAVAAVCSAGSSVSVVDLKSLGANALPAVMAVVNASPLSDQDKTKIGIDLTVAQIVLSSVLASLPATAAPASAASGV
jgi:hypothetical protein